MSTTAGHTLDLVDEALQEALHRLVEDWAALAGPPRDRLDTPDLPQLAQHASQGGKRLRPEMVHWGWVAAGAPPSEHAQVVVLGAALELLHVFALVHDDVMDGSQTRRGVPAVHAAVRDAHRQAAALGDAQAYGNHVAVLTGDLVHAEADHLAATLPEAVRRTWRTMMLELVLGQRLDLTGAATGRRDLEQARTVARLKSGSYTIQRPLQMGAQLGDAGPQLLERLELFGQHAGEAFGLRDDLLGTFGARDQTGKPVDDDLTAGKPTVLLALAAERLDPDDARLLASAADRSLTAGEVAHLRQALEAHGIRDEVEQMVATQADLATRALEHPAVPDEAREALTHTLHRIAWRTA